MSTNSIKLTRLSMPFGQALELAINPADRREQQRLQALQAYRSAVPPGAFRGFSLTPLDKTGIPVWAVSYRSEDGYMNDGIGYGASQVEALCGAFGELIETAMNHAAMARLPSIERKSYQQLVNQKGREHVVDPRSLCLEAGTPDPLTQPLDWVPALTLSEQREVWVPREFVANSGQQLRHENPLITPITNGLGAGCSQEQAISHAVMELLQRDGNGIAFRAMDRGIVIELDEIQDAGLKDLLTLAEQSGIRVIPKLATTEFGFVNVYVVGKNVEEDPWFALQTTACGEASHPAREAAIRKALLEYFAARARKTFMHGPLDQIVEKVTGSVYMDDYMQHLDLSAEEPRALQSMCEWLQKTSTQLAKQLDSTVFSQQSTVALSTLPSEPVADDPLARLDVLQERLGKAELDILFVDFADNTAKDQGVHAVRAIVPGLECETMSYGRMGYRGVQRALQEGLDFVRVGNQPNPGALAIAMTEAQTEMVGGPAWLDRTRIDAIVGPLYPLYREPHSHAAQRALMKKNQPFVSGIN
jgi:ribosomal protein S12 methylthiotransferase accessory factor